MRILGIETSCDESAAAVLDAEGRLLSSVVASQAELHAPYGGVVPEIAARHHIGALDSAVATALEDASLTIDDIDGIAVTRGPGLIGCLLIGVSFARGLALARKIPLVGVNHLEGHIASGWLDQPELPFPSLALVVSGGHTALWWVAAPGDYEELARTRDDAAGEAFDKAAKMMGLPYPGGPAIDRLAPRGNIDKQMFGEVRIKGAPAFSFSGYKTAVRQHMQRQNIEPLASPEDEPPQPMLDLIASLRYAIVRETLRRVKRVLEDRTPASLVLAGGVAANALLREETTKLAAERQLPLSIPAMKYCGDNAAMIALAGRRRLLAGENEVDTVDTVAHLPLGGAEAQRTSRRHR